jgi:nucleoside 2-deoxyribosyltransferase
MRKTIFLAGRVDGLDRTEAMKWRDGLKHFLEPEFDVVLPEYVYKPEISNELWGRNYFLLDNSDILVVNMKYEENEKFLGISMEMGRAFYQRKPIIIYSDKDWVKNNHTLRYHATAIIGNQSELLDYIKTFA